MLVDETRSWEWAVFRVGFRVRVVRVRVRVRGRGRGRGRTRVRVTIAVRLNFVVDDSSID